MLLPWSTKISGLESATAAGTLAIVKLMECDACYQNALKQRSTSSHCFKVFSNFKEISAIELNPSKVLSIQPSTWPTSWRVLWPRPAQAHDEKIFKNLPQCMKKHA